MFRSFRPGKSLCNTVTGAMPARLSGVALAIALATGLMVGVTSADAAPVSGQEAKGLLFATKGYAMAVSPRLSEAEQTLIRKIVELSQDQDQSLEYYASLAYSPDEGLQSQAFQAASGHHSVKAADAAAMAACNAKRASGTTACTVAARVLPSKFSERPLTLSRAATEAFGKDYPTQGGALAISPSTGGWTIARGGEATGKALDECNAKAGAGDCAIVIAE